jgi:ubiquinone/menaquinone biosynthesis C-methylase UbiE
VTASDIWLDEAEGWAAWARQGDDGFFEFRALLPLPGLATLDLGCGEGRFARLLAAEGHRVTGVDVRAVGEAARVLEPGGRLCVCITHPMRDAGRFRDGTFVIAEPYLEKRRFEMTVARGGLEVSFRSWAYPLETYTRALEDAGFVIETLREPPDPDRPIPNFLLFRARK